MTQEERNEARAQWERLLRQHHRMEERLRYLDEHPNDPDFDVLSEKAGKSTARFHELQEELLQWSGADPDEYGDLFREVWAELQARATKTEAA